MSIDHATFSRTLWGTVDNADNSNNNTDIDQRKKIDTLLPLCGVISAGLLFHWNSEEEVSV